MTRTITSIPELFRRGSRHQFQALRKFERAEREARNARHGFHPYGAQGQAQGQRDAQAPDEEEQDAGDERAAHGADVGGKHGAGDGAGLALLDAGGAITGPSIEFLGGSISSFSDRPDSTRNRRGRRVRTPAVEGEDAGLGLGAERARILLRSLTVPGWGQASLGHRHAAAWFGTVELGIWSAFTAFHIQEAMRTENALRTARLFAGIDLHGRDDEFRRIVGAFSSSEQYNLLVVTRDAANLYLSDVSNPDMAGYRAYIAAHSLTGADAWAWSDTDAERRYLEQRKDANRAALRANTALGLAVANRLVSALLAARQAGHAPRRPTHAWHLEVTPTPGPDPTAYRAGVRASF